MAPINSSCCILPSPHFVLLVLLKCTRIPAEDSVNSSFTASKNPLPVTIIKGLIEPYTSNGKKRLRAILALWNGPGNDEGCRLHGPFAYAKGGWQKRTLEYGGGVSKKRGLELG
jgi:hypothetical protein